MRNPARRLRSPFIIALVPLCALAACQDAAAPAEPDIDMPEMADTRPGLDESQGIVSADGEVVTATSSGTVMAADPGTGFLTLDHAPIEAIGMGAMTMGFDVADDVDLSGLSAGDAVLFRIDATASGIVLTAICRPAVDGTDCLAPAPSPD